MPDYKSLEEGLYNIIFINMTILSTIFSPVRPNATAYETTPSLIPNLLIIKPLLNLNHLKHFDLERSVEFT